jgi:hypothetical protein
MLMSQNIVWEIIRRRIKQAGHVVCIRDMREDSAYVVLFRNPQRWKKFRIPKGRLEDNVKMNHKEIVCENGDWVPLPQVRYEDSPDQLSCYEFIN